MAYEIEIATVVVIVCMLLLFMRQGNEGSEAKQEVMRFAARPLRQVFDEYAMYGKTKIQLSFRRGGMDGTELMKLAKQCKFLGKKVTRTDLDIWFSFQAHGMHTITFEQFQNILQAIAHKTGMDMEEIEERVMRSPPPGF